MKRDISLFLKDILDSISSIEKFIKNLSFNDFVNDDKTSSAVIRKIEIIGEAAKNIPQSIHTKYEEIPWKEIAGMRDKIIHSYFGVDYELIWKVVVEDLKNIKVQVMKILNDMNGLLF
jgi:uncharacterized protein with HEPN domain